jgi:lipopolysaccharide export system protein LptC
MTLAMNVTDAATDPGRPPSLRSAAAYRAARRHSLFVRFLRIAIPIGALASFSAFIVWPFINPFPGAGVTVGNVKMDGTRIMMESPRLAGHRKDNKPYEVTAASALQDIRVPNVIELVEMKARLVNTNDAVLNLTAKRAVFDTQKEQLQLREDVKVVTENGQEAQMRSADVDFKAGTVRSREGVTVRLPDMSVSAEALDITESGGKIAFVGRVRALIDDKDSAARASKAQPQSSTPAAQPRSAPAQPPASAPADPAPRDARGVTLIDPATGRALPRSAP